MTIIDQCGGSDWRDLESYLGNEIFDEFSWDLFDVNVDNEREMFINANHNQDISEY